MIFSVTTKLQSFLQNEKAAAIFEQFLPDFSDTVKSNPRAAQLSTEQLVHYAVCLMVTVFWHDWMQL